MVTAVVDTPSQAGAGRQVYLITRTVNVVQEDQACPIAKVCIGSGRQGVAAPYLLADHPRFLQVPVVITHCAPVSTVIDLHPPLTAVQPSDQPD